jgi:integrase
MPVKKAPLTVKQVENARFEGKPRKVGDGGGLFLLVNQTGKYWRFKYRFGGADRPPLALGVFPEVSLAEAREEREKLRGMVRKGIDPRAERRAKKASGATMEANTFEIVAREWWDSRYRQTVVAEHSGRQLRRLEMYIFPPLGHHPISEIAPLQLLDTLNRLVNAGNTETAHRILNMCGQIFRHAVVTGRAERDIAADLRGALPPATKKHYPAITDPEHIGELLRAIYCYSGYPATRGALILNTLVFVRPGELRQAEWDDFDLEAARWEFTASKTAQPLVVPLPRQAISILREMESLSGGGRYVFHSVRGRGRAMSENTINFALKQMGFSGQMVGHSFRAIARTLLVERLDYPADIVEQQLAHNVIDALGRAYNRVTFLDQRREMLQKWADYLDTLRDTANERVDEE